MCVQRQADQPVLLLLMFELGAQALLFYIQMKIGACKQLPLLLAGVAHRNTGVARELARTCVARILASAFGSEHAECRYVLAHVQQDVGVHCDRGVDA